MKKITSTLAITMLFIVSMLMGTSPANALGKVKCDVAVSGKSIKGDVALASVALDPIVYHNVDPNDSSVPQPHQHNFFGNRAAFQFENRAEYSDVINAGTSCRDSRDTGAYWAPVLRYKSGPKAGQEVPVQQFTAYYRGFAGQTTHAGSRAFPADTRLVAQDMVGYGLSGWTCGAFSAVTGGQDTIPDCSGEDGTPGNVLTAHVSFPSCWNGNLPNHSSSEQGDTRDNADYIYPTNKTACPASHPIETVQLRETIQYDYTGDGTDVELSSDHDVAPGSSMHVDFWNTWNQAGFEQFVKDCINTRAERNCDI